MMLEFYFSEKDGIVGTKDSIKGPLERFEFFKEDWDAAIKSVKSWKDGDGVGTMKCGSTFNWRDTTKTPEEVKESVLENG